MHTHTLTHLARGQGKKKRIALKQLAEGQPAKRVGERDIHRARERENKGREGERAGKSLHSPQEELCQGRKRLVWAWRFPGWLED